jgi:hypothetical protein
MVLLALVWRQVRTPLETNTAFQRRLIHQIPTFNMRIGRGDNNSIIERIIRPRTVSDLIGSLSIALAVAVHNDQNDIGNGLGPAMFKVMSQLSEESAQLSHCA